MTPAPDCVICKRDRSGRRPACDRPSPRAVQSGRRLHRRVTVASAGRDAHDRRGAEKAQRHSHDVFHLLQAKREKARAGRCRQETAGDDERLPAEPECVRARAPSFDAIFGAGARRAGPRDRARRQCARRLRSRTRWRRSSARAATVPAVSRDRRPSRVRSATRRSAAARPAPGSGTRDPSHGTRRSRRKRPSRRARPSIERVNAPVLLSGQDKRPGRKRSTGKGERTMPELAARRELGGDEPTHAKVIERQ